MHHEEILRKLPRTISQESTNVSMDKTHISLFQQNRAEKIGGRRGREKKIPAAMVANEKIAQEEQQPGLSRRCSNLADSLNDERRNEEEDEATTYKICKILWI